MAKKYLMVRAVKNGYVVEYEDDVDGLTETVFAKYFQVMRFIKDYLKEEV